MSRLSNYRFPPPAKWQDLEDLCADLWRLIWKDENAQKNGRSGQPQHGVDIFGRPDCGEEWAGVQCKGKDELLGSALTETELLEEVEKAKKFVPRLSRFTIVSSGPRDSSLQERARLLTQEHHREGLFSVHVWCWEDVLLRLSNYPDVVLVHFPHFRPLATFDATVPDPSRTVPEPRSSAGGAASLASFAPPEYGTRMVKRQSLCRTIDEHLGKKSSVYLQAPSGYGKSVVLSQLALPNFAWIDGEDNRQFRQFRDTLNSFLNAKYGVSTALEPPRELAAAFDRIVATVSDAPLALAIDHADRVDNGVKAFLESLVSVGTGVRVILAANSLKFRRQKTLETSARLAVISARRLAFTEDETLAVITAPLPDVAHAPSQRFGEFVFGITDGWPIAVRLIRARLESDPDEEAALGSLRQIATQELGGYLLESYWGSLDDLLKSLLVTTSIFPTFDRSDAEATIVGRISEDGWDDLRSLPFVSHLAKAPGLLLYQPMFKAFLCGRLATERTPEEIRQIHGLAALHFIQEKQLAPAAFHHARLSRDPGIITRATGELAEYSFRSGAYPALEEALNTVSPTARWDDPTLAVYQGRLYEHNEDLTNALKWYRRAQTLFDQAGPDFWRLGIVNDIGAALRKAGKGSEAIELYNRALAQLPEDEPSTERAQLLANRANVFLQTGALERAEDGFQAAKDIWELSKDSAGLGRVYQGLANVATKRNRDREALTLRTKALRWARRAGDQDLFLTVALPVGEGLLNAGRYRQAQRVYRNALDAAMASGSLGALPFLSNNFGLACALAPEPDRDGLAALTAALEMKRAAKIPAGGTLQNLCTLLMRLGDFERALPVAQEQLSVAREKGDAALGNDAAAKLLALTWVLSDAETADNAADQLNSRTDREHMGARRLVVEGRVRAALRDRWPLVLDLVRSEADGAPDTAIRIGHKTFRLEDALTVLVVWDGVDVDEEVPGPDREENFVFELVEPLSADRKGPGDGSANRLAAIWWIRTDRSCWVQTFWHEKPASKDAPGRIGVSKGSLFAFDSETGRWTVAEHPEGCECGRPEVHEEVRSFAQHLALARLTGGVKQDVVIGKRRCEVVALNTPMGESERNQVS
jgi:tetratricopeptide (TPR) repeat protein